MRTEVRIFATPDGRTRPAKKFDQAAAETVATNCLAALFADS